MKWHGTKYKGVRYREHPTRKHGLKKDRYYSIRYQKDGKRIEEGLGWTSEVDPNDNKHWTAEKAALMLARLRGAANQGKRGAPTRIAEQREIEKKRRAEEQAEKEKEKQDAVTFGQYFEKVYFPAFTVGRKHETTRKAKEHFKKWIEPVIGNTPLKNIKPFTIEKIKKNVLDAGKSARSLQYILATVRQTWNHARRNGRVSGDSPTKSISIPKVDNRRVRFLSHKEAETLLEALKKEDSLTHNLALLSLHTGLRVGEMASLQWSHIDTEHGTIRVMDPKSGRGRTVFMTDRVKAMFDRMKRSEPEAIVFIRGNGDPVKEMPRTFKEVVKALGLNEGITDARQKVVAHTLRHSYASWHAMAGTDIYTLKELLGHSVIQMTERYSHLSPGTLQRATRNLEKAIERAGQKPGEVIHLDK